MTHRDHNNDNNKVNSHTFSSLFLYGPCMSVQEKNNTTKNKEGSFIETGCN